MRKDWVTFREDRLQQSLLSCVGDSNVAIFLTVTALFAVAAVEPLLFLCSLFAALVHIVPAVATEIADGCRTVISGVTSLMPPAEGLLVLRSYCLCIK